MCLGGWFLDTGIPIMLNPPNRCVFEGVFRCVQMFFEGAFKRF